MSKFLQIVYLLWSGLIRLIGWVVSLAVVFLSVVVLILQTAPVKDFILGRLEDGFNSTFASRLEAESLSGFIPLNVKLQSVSLSSESDTGEEPFIRARQIQVYFDLAELLKGSWTIETLRLIEPQIATSFDAQSQSFDIGSLFIRRTQEDAAAGVGAGGGTESGLTEGSGSVAGSSGDSSVNSGAVQSGAAERAVDERPWYAWLRKNIDSFSSALLIPEIAITDGRGFIRNSSALVEGMALPDPFILEEVFAELYVESAANQQILEIQDFMAEAPGTEFESIQISGQFYRSPDLLEWNGVTLKTLGSSLEIGISVETDSTVSNLDLLSVEGYRDRAFEIEISIPRLDPSEIGTLFPTFQALTPRVNNVLIGEIEMKAEEGVLYLDRMDLFTGQSTVSLRGRWTMGDDPLEGLDVDLLALQLDENDFESTGIWNNLALAFPDAVINGSFSTVSDPTATISTTSMGSSKTQRQIEIEISLLEEKLRSQFKATVIPDQKTEGVFEATGALIMDSLVFRAPPVGDWFFVDRLREQVGGLAASADWGSSGGANGASTFYETLNTWLDEPQAPFLVSGAISFDGHWDGEALTKVNGLANLYDLDVFGVSVQSISALVSKKADEISYGFSSVQGDQTLELDGSISLATDSSWWSQHTRLDPLPANWISFLEGAALKSQASDVESASEDIATPAISIRSTFQQGFPDLGSGWVELSTSRGSVPEGVLEPLQARVDFVQPMQGDSAQSILFTSTVGNASLKGSFRVSEIPKHLRTQSARIQDYIEQITFQDSDAESEGSKPKVGNSDDSVAKKAGESVIQNRQTALSPLQGQFVMDVKRSDLIRLFVPDWPSQTFATVQGEIHSDSSRLDLRFQLTDSSFAQAAMKADSISLELVSSFDFDSPEQDSSTVSLQLSAARVGFGNLTLHKVNSSHNLSEGHLISTLMSEKAQEIDHLSWRLQGNLSGEEIRIEPEALSIGRGLELWSLTGEPQLIIERSGRLRLDEILLQNKTQEILLDGTWGSEPDESLLVRMKEVDVGGITGLLQKLFRFEGRMDGQFVARRLNDVPVFEGEIGIDSLVFNGQLAGNLFLESTVDQGTGDYLAQLRLFTDPERYAKSLAAAGATGHDFLINGRFVNPLAPGADSLLYSVDADFRQIDLILLEELMPNILARSRGLATGRGSIIGRRDDVEISGDFNILESSATPIFLNTQLFVTGNVTYSNDVGFTMNRLALSDPYGGRGQLNGKAGMTQFDGVIPLDLTLVADNMLLINNPYDPDIPFYSTVYGSGTFRLTGTQYAPLVQTPVPVRVSGGSKVSVPLLDETELITDSGFITFVENFDDAKPVSRSGISGPESSGEQVGAPISFSERFSLDLQFESNEIVTFEMIFDPLTNDMISANGSGQIGIRLEDETYSMFGQLNIESGVYNFVSGDILARRFQLQRGGTIRWDGDPVNARLDVSAVYRARPPLSTLGVTGAASATSVGQRIPIELVLQIFGTIDQIENEFFFQLPTNFTGISDPTLATRLTSLNRNQEEKLIQAFSILLTGNFIPSRETTFEDTSVLEGLTGSAVVINPFVSTQVISPLLSNQINSLLTQDVTFDVDVNIDAYNEVELGVALRLYNDRLVLRREGQITGEQSTIGDIGATFQINRTLSLTAFHRQDPAFSTSASTGGGVGSSGGAETQTINGMGVQASTQFHSWGELRKRISDTFSSIFRRKKGSGSGDENDSENGQNEGADQPNGVSEDVFDNVTQDFFDSSDGRKRGLEGSEPGAGSWSGSEMGSDSGSKSESGSGSQPRLPQPPSLSGTVPKPSEFEFQL